MTRSGTPGLEVEGQLIEGWFDLDDMYSTALGADQMGFRWRSPKVPMEAAGNLSPMMCCWPVESGRVEAGLKLGFACVGPCSAYPSTVGM